MTNYDNKQTFDNVNKMNTFDAKALIGSKKWKQLEQENMEKAIEKEKQNIEKEQYKKINENKYEKIIEQDKNYNTKITKTIDKQGNIETTTTKNIRKLPTNWDEIQQIAKQIRKTNEYKHIANFEAYDKKITKLKEKLNKATNNDKTIQSWLKTGPKLTYRKNTETTNEQYIQDRIQAQQERKQSFEPLMSTESQQHNENIIQEEIRKQLYYTPITTTRNITRQVQEKAQEKLNKSIEQKQSLAKNQSYEYQKEIEEAVKDTLQENYGLKPYERKRLEAIRQRKELTKELQKIDKELIPLKTAMYTTTGKEWEQAKEKLKIKKRERKEIRNTIRNRRRNDALARETRKAIKEVYKQTSKLATSFINNKTTPKKEYEKYLENVAEARDIAKIHIKHGAKEEGEAYKDLLQITESILHSGSSKPVEAVANIATGAFIGKALGLLNAWGRGSAKMIPFVNNGKLFGKWNPTTLQRKNILVATGAGIGLGAAVHHTATTIKKSDMKNYELGNQIVDWTQIGAGINIGARTKILIPEQRIKQIGKEKYEIKEVQEIKPKPSHDKIPTENIGKTTVNRLTKTEQFKTSKGNTLIQKTEVYTNGHVKITVHDTKQPWTKLVYNYKKGNTALLQTKQRGKIIEETIVKQKPPKIKEAYKEFIIKILAEQKATASTTQHTPRKTRTYNTEHGPITITEPGKGGVPVKKGLHQTKNRKLAFETKLEPTGKKGEYKHTKGTITERVTQESQVKRSQIDNIQKTEIQQLLKITENNKHNPKIAQMIKEVYKHIPSETQGVIETYLNNKISKQTKHKLELELTQQQKKYGKKILPELKEGKNKGLPKIETEHYYEGKKGSGREHSLVQKKHEPLKHQKKIERHIKYETETGTEKELLQKIRQGKEYKKRLTPEEFAKALHESKIIAYNEQTVNPLDTKKSVNFGEAMSIKSSVHKNRQIIKKQLKNYSKKLRTEKDPLMKQHYENKIKEIKEILENQKTQNKNTIDQINIYKKTINKYNKNPQKVIAHELTHALKQPVKLQLAADKITNSKLYNKLLSTENARYLMNPLELHANAVAPIRAKIGYKAPKTKNSVPEILQEKLPGKEQPKIKTEKPTTVEKWVSETLAKPKERLQEINKRIKQLEKEKGTLAKQELKKLKEMEKLVERKKHINNEAKQKLEKYIYDNPLAERIHKIKTKAKIRTEIKTKTEKLEKDIKKLLKKQKIKSKKQIKKQKKAVKIENKLLQQEKQKSLEDAKKELGIKSKTQKILEKLKMNQKGQATLKMPSLEHANEAKLRKAINKINEWRVPEPELTPIQQKTIKEINLEGKKIGKGTKKGILNNNKNNNLNKKLNTNKKIIANYNNNLNKIINEVNTEIKTDPKLKPKLQPKLDLYLQLQLELEAKLKLIEKTKERIKLQAQQPIVNSKTKTLVAAKLPVPKTKKTKKKEKKKKDKGPQRAVHPWAFTGSFNNNLKTQQYITGIQGTTDLVGTDNNIAMQRYRK